MAGSKEKRLERAEKVGAVLFKMSIIVGGVDCMRQYGIGNPVQYEAGMGHDYCMTSWPNEIRIMSQPATNRLY